MPSDERKRSDVLPAGEGYHFQGVLMPAHLQASLEHYQLDGRPTGDFLRACLANDLIGASFRADDQNFVLLPVIGAYIAHYIRPEIRGSEKAIDDWIQKKREEREKEKR